MKKSFRARKLLPFLLLTSALVTPLQTTAFAQNESAEGSAGDAAATKEVAHPWAIENIDLPADDAVRYGILPNGMRYALRKNETPEKAASIRMLVHVGSIAEAENERGLAHFIEHMAFNGSTNIPEGEMVALLEKQGLSFGLNTNATTSFTETIYKLDVPDANKEALGLALMVMRETASNLTIGEEAVDRERGVVKSERQLRNTADLRSAKVQLALELPDSPISERLPIGLTDVVQTAPASRLRNFYHRYYRPENTTLVVVGDVDLDVVEATIKSGFGDWEGVGEAGAPVDYGTINPDREFTIDSFADPAVRTRVILSKSKPFETLPNSVEANLEPLLMNLATKVMGDRFTKIVLKPDTSIIGAAALPSPVENISLQQLLVTVGKEGDWQGALATAEQELRRALEHGFTQAEVEEQLVNLNAELKNAADQQVTRRSSALAEELIRSSVNKSVVITPATALAIFETLRPALTAENVSAAFRKNWAGGPNSLFVTTAAPIENDKSTIREVLTASQQVAVEAPVDVEAKPFAYTDFGAEGKVVADSIIEDLGIRTITFENGVRLNLKTTDFSAGKINYSVKIGQGLSAIPESAGGLAYYMENVFPVGGLGEHSVEELQKLVAGKQVNLSLNAEQDAFTAAGSTPTNDVAFQFQLLTALITDPGYRPEADAIWQNALPTINTQNKATPIAVLQSEFRRILAGGDTRIGRGNAEELGAMNMGLVRNLISDQLNHGAIDIAIVGEIDQQAAIDIVAKTFGALPKREPEKVDVANIKPLPSPEEKVFTLTHNGQADQGVALAVWPTDDDADHKDDVTRDLLAASMGILLTDVVREELGATYSTQAFSRSSSLYPDDGFMAALAIADPAKAEEIYAATRAIASRMRERPISEEVFTRSREPLLEQLEKLDGSNAAWAGIAVNAQRRPDRLDRWRARKELAASVTIADIQSAAQKYLKDETLIELRIVPAPLAEEE